MADAEDTYDYGMLLVIQHDPDVDLSAAARSIDERAARRPVHVVRLDEGQALPALTSSIRGILVLGGPQSVADGRTQPWLEDERQLLKSAIGAEVPVFGICLGAQVLALALGGEVTQREQAQVDIVPLVRTEPALDDDVFAGWPDGAPALFANNDRIQALPDDAVQMLDGSDGVAAFHASGGLAVGVQFHPEASAETFDRWVARDDFAPTWQSGGVEGSELGVRVREHERFLRAAGVSLIGRWVDSVVGAGDPSPRKHRK